MIIRISSVVSPSFVLGQFSSVLVMHHRFLPISTGRCCLAAGGAWCWAGRKKCVCGHGGQPADSSHQADPIRDIRTQLPASGCSHLPPPHPAIYLSLPSARSLARPLACTPAAPLPLFLIFPSKTDPTLSSRAWPATAPLLEQRRNDLISPPPLSLWPPRAAHTQIITRRGLIFTSLRGHPRAFN